MIGKNRIICSVVVILLALAVGACTSRGSDTVVITHDPVVATSTETVTFFATAEAIWIAGCTAVLVDCDPRTRCIDPEKIRNAVSKRTKAIVPVHLYGQCAPVQEIRKIADEYGLLVVEDNAQAIDAYGDGFKIGELSDAVCTS